MHVTLDDRTIAALARLTENEKQCLRRRLLPQTAKEMAIDLGVSPHAVEKRLKMARTKLGMSSSLDAARLLAATESRLAVPQASDLSPGTEPDDAVPRSGGGRRSIIIGATAMSIAIAAALVVHSIGSAGPAQDKQAGKRTTPEAAAAFLGKDFDSLDRNHSGFVDPDEVPLTMVRLDNGTTEVIEPVRAYVLFVARSDGNGDGRISRAEYVSANRARIEAAGIPKDWKPNG